MNTAFNAGSGWRIDSIDPDLVETKYHDNGVPAWFTTIKRIGFSDG